MLQKSLRAQILALLSGSLLAMLLIALACFHFLSSGVQSYANLIDGPLHTSQLIDEANLQFKVQVQEWKNVLLRGKQPADLDKYWRQFEDRQRDVQSILGELAAQKGIEPHSRPASNACVTNTASWARLTRRVAMPMWPPVPTRRLATPRSKAWTAPPAIR